MTDDSSAGDWARVDELLAAALSREAPLRADFVRQESAGDARLQREVMQMLNLVTESESAIGDSAEALLPSGPLVDAPDVVLVEGTLLGSYTIGRLLGRGGMGNVYAAVRTDGTLQREVAVKVVREGVAAPELPRRLRQEQKILARLEHPRIARLYDSGVTTSGTPFLVMELVVGERLDRYVANRSVEQIIALFDEVCEAVAFAHQRLVVHRDLKPANILVAADGHVRLLDFGIARLLADVDGDTPSTRTGHLVLTPEYASPEQARGDSASVSMDVYALGVILHELLVGARPAWQRQVVTRADNDAIERAMTAPSRSATETSRARHLRGDLDLVILTALAPDPVRRYPTVQALRDDLRRVREGYPIQARRAPWSERALRALRRNPVAAVAWFTAAGLALAFVANTFVQQQRVIRERDRAEAERDRARTTSRVLSTLFERADPFSPGTNDTLRVSQVLTEGVDRVNHELASQPGARAELLTAIGHAFRGLGRFDDAQSALDTAQAVLARAPDVAAAERAAILSALGTLAQARGRTAAAESLHVEALRLREDSVEPADSRERTIAISNVGAALMDLGQLDSARAFVDTALARVRRSAPRDSSLLADVLNTRATLAMRLGELGLASELTEEAVAINRIRLGPQHPRVVTDLTNLGFLLDRTGRSAQAEPVLREALRALEDRLPEDHPAIQSARLTLGGILSRSNRLDEAAEMLAGVVAAARKAGADGTNGLPISLDNYAGVLEKLGRMREAQSHYREAYEIQRARSNPRDPGISILRSKVADINCRLDGASGGVLAEHEAALGTLDAVFPAGHPFRIGPRGTYGSCLIRAGRRQDGERELRTSFDTARLGPPQLHGMARQFGEELVRLYSAPADSAKRAEVSTFLDALKDGRPGGVSAR